MRTAIHMFLPEDLEEHTEENDPSITGDQRPTEDPFTDPSDAAHLSFTPNAF